MIRSNIKVFFLSCIALLPTFAFSLTLEEKVGQLLMAHFEGEEVCEDARALVEDVAVGGIIYYNFSNGSLSFPKVSALSHDLQTLAKKRGLPPLLIAADQEGGIVARCTEGFTIFPGNGALGAIGDEGLAEEVAFTMGKEIKAAGINMNLSPVVDVNSNSENPVIGLRSFGDSKDRVISLAKSMMDGYQRAGVLTCLKHFPGHGDTSVDSHLVLPVVTKSKAELEEVEFVPFARLAKDADSIMTAHIKMEKLDPDFPATTSKKILSILREEMRFNGVIATDSLVMEGFLKGVSSVEEGALAALLAGSDLIILGGKQLNTGLGNLELKVEDVKRIHAFLVKAVKDGKLKEEQVDASYARILKMKSKYGVEQRDSITENRELALRVAKSALNITRKGSVILDKDTLILAPKIVQKAMKEQSLEGKVYFFELNPSEEEIALIKQMAEGTSSIIFCSYNAWRFAGQKELLSFLSPSALIALRDPVDGEILPSTDLLIQAYSPTAPSIQAAFAEIIKK